MLFTPTPKLSLLLVTWWHMASMRRQSAAASSPAVPQLNGQHFRITALQEHGFLDMEDTNNGDDLIEYSGYLIDMLSALAKPERGNFTYTLLPPSGYGSLCAPRLDNTSTTTTSTGSNEESAAEGSPSPYDARYRTQYNCGASDVNDGPLTAYATDMYLGMYYVTPSRQQQNQFTLPFVPPFSGTLAMFGTATGIPDFETLVQLQSQGQQPPACAPAGTALIDFIPAAFPGLKVQGLFGGEDEILQAFQDGTCTVYITDGPIAAQFVLRRSRRNQCFANGGRPIGVIGDPMGFGLSHYAIGIRRDLDPIVEHTISYWINVLMSCNPLDPEGGCTDGNLASFYEGRGGDGTECGYVLYPSSHEILSPGAISAIVVASVTFVVLVSFILHKYRLARQRRHYQRRQKAALAMAERERQLNEVLAHEIRNPLASAIAAMTLVSSKATDPQVVPLVENRTSFKEDFRIMDNSLQFVNELLRNMLDVHRTNDKAMKLHLGPTDILKDVLEPVASIICIRGTRASVETVCEPTELIVQADKMRLKQICLNLAVNASKFVEKGFIQLSAHVEQTDGEPKMDNVVICISDSGPGIPAHKKQQLFAKFQESLDVLNQGTGIGLSVCKNLSDLMGADLYLDENFDSGVDGYVGTRFVLRLNQSPIDLEKEGISTRSLSATNGLSVALPNGDSNAVDSPRSSLSFQRSLPPQTSVLFVDDDMILRNMFRRTLERVAPQGWQVTQASSGEAALQLIDNGESFDLIFMDFYMASHHKQLLGTEAIRALRSRNIQSIICGLSANDKEEEFLEAGADAFLLKPFPCEKKALTEALWYILDSRSSDVEEGRSSPVKSNVAQEGALQCH